MSSHAKLQVYRSIYTFSMFRMAGWGGGYDRQFVTNHRPVKMTVVIITPTGKQGKT